MDEILIERKKSKVYCRDCYYLIVPCDGENRCEAKGLKNEYLHDYRPIQDYRKANKNNDCKDYKYGSQGMKMWGIYEDRNF